MIVLSRKSFKNDWLIIVGCPDRYNWCSTGQKFNGGIILSLGDCFIMYSWLTHGEPLLVSVAIWWFGWESGECDTELANFKFLDDTMPVKKSSIPKPNAPKATTKSVNITSDLVSTINTTYNDYIKSLTPRTKLIDIFLLYLLLLGGLQFIYVILIGNFPFNAFLGGFIGCVGQFVLTVNLRLQYNKANLKIFPSSPERAFGDYIFASLILHFLVYHFIN